ncbi:hypothetical protein [Microvirga vignae]|nr:hypothetical protein [Microvirga vignae]
MTDMEELKQLIADTWRDEELSSSACWGVEAYSRLWPFVFFVNDWDVWNENRKDLKPSVYNWLNKQDTAWDFYHLLGGWGLVGLKDRQTAEHFKLRWSGTLKAVPSPEETWNPHPLNSSFACDPGEEVAKPVRLQKRVVRSFSPLGRAQGTNISVQTRAPREA